MKTLKILLSILAIGNYCLAQKVSIAPHVGMNFNSFSYPKSNIAPNSILTYPKDINLGYQLGGDLIYAKGNKKHVLSISSVPLGVQFKGAVLNRESGRIVTTFKVSTNDRQPLLSYQFFINRRISKNNNKREISFFYGGGVGVGLNRSKEFYKVNNYPIQDDQIRSEDSIYFSYMYTKRRNGMGYFVMPEIGITYHNKKGKAIINASMYYYIGLRPQVYYDLTLQYGKFGTSYFEEERPTLGTRGSFYGAKLSFPFQLFSIKQSPLKKKT